MFKKSLMSLLMAGLLVGTAAYAQDDSEHAEASFDTDNDVVLRTEKGEAPADGVNTLEMDASIGEYNIIATDTGSISWQVNLTVDEDDATDYKRQLAAKFEITAERQGDRYVISIKRPDDDEKGEMNETIVESLTVHLPARLALAMNANIGEVTIEGVAGGVTLDFNIGDIDVEIPGGAVDIDSNIGDVVLVTRTDSLGEVDLDVNIGEINFDNAGADVEPEYNFPVGQELHIDSDGNDSIDIGLNIGEVDVEVEK